MSFLNKKNIFFYKKVYFRPLKDSRLEREQRLLDDVQALPQLLFLDDQRRRESGQTTKVAISVDET
jgi:hypothetical protein